MKSQIPAPTDWSLYLSTKKTEEDEKNGGGGDSGSGGCFSLKKPF